MGIGRIGGFYQSYSIDSIKKVDVATVKEQDAVKKQQENLLPENTKDTQSQPDTRSRMADLENISLSFNSEDTYDYIGKDADISLLDMDKVLSDMKKDSVLDQYNYFVGSEATDGFVPGLAGDGIVIAK